MTPQLSSMSAEQKRIAIAQACGRCPHTEKEYWSIEDGNDFDSGFTCKKCGEDPHRGSARLPDYLNSLDACHEMEEVMHSNHSLATDYASILEANVSKTKHSGTGLFFQVINASPAQRADAFLLALNLATK